MKNVAIVNVCDWGSTGKLSLGLQKELMKNGYNAHFCYGRGQKKRGQKCYRFDYYPEVLFHWLLTQLTGLEGLFSSLATWRLIRYLKKIKCDTIYALNLRGYFINEKMFYNFIGNHNIKLVYIMIDEYAYLGICGYSRGCEGYVDNCMHCAKGKIKTFWHIFSPGRVLYKIKNNGYNKIKDIVFVGPEYVIKCAGLSPIMNGRKFEILDEAIDVDQFYPRDNQKFRNELGIKDDQIALVCVAPVWYPTKGSQYFLELARRLENDNRYVFIQVGYKKGFFKDLPSNYRPVGFVSDQESLAKYYSLADLFVFPSFQDTMPNACLEALACGSPLLCFNTSGMPYIGDETVATFVEPHSVDELERVVKAINRKNSRQVKVCRDYALSRYDNKRYASKLIIIGENSYDSI